MEVQSAVFYLFDVDISIGLSLPEEVRPVKCECEVNPFEEEFSRSQNVVILYNFKF